MRKLKNDELDRLSIDQFHESSKTPLTIILDNVRSLNNIGSIFRTGDGFRIEKIILCGISTTPPHRDIHKTALGAEDSVSWEYFSETIDAVRKLKGQGYHIAAIEQADNSISLKQFTPTKGQALGLIFGHEVKGVQQDVVNESDSCIEIPQLGTKHSFNVSVCVGIVLWDLFVKISSLPD